MLGHSLDDLALLRSKLGGTTLGQVGSGDDGEIQPDGQHGHQGHLQLGQGYSWPECS